MKHDAIVKTINEYKRMGDSQKIYNLLFDIKSMDYTDKPGLPIYLALVLTTMGTSGFKAIDELLKLDDSVTRRSAIIHVLLMVGENKNITSSLYISEEVNLISQVFDEKVRFQCKDSIQDIFYAARDDTLLFDHFVKATIENQSFDTEESKTQINRLILDMFTGDSISINSRNLKEYEMLLNQKNVIDGTFQNFFKNNKSHIDPLAMEILDKTKLGDDLITDFVVRKYDNSYILVDVEKPNDKLFSKDGNFSEKFTQSIGHLLDYQNWIEDNTSFIQDNMPHINSPSALLIMGRKKDMPGNYIKKLNRFNLNNKGKLTVMTYDEIKERNRELYQNILSNS